MNPHNSKKYGFGELNFTCLFLQSSWHVWVMQLAMLKVDIIFIYICVYVYIFAGGIEMIELGNFVLYIYMYYLQS